MANAKGKVTQVIGAGIPEQCDEFHETMLRESFSPTRSW